MIYIEGKPVTPRSFYEHLLDKHAKKENKLINFKEALWYLK